MRRRRVAGLLGTILAFAAGGIFVLPVVMMIAAGLKPEAEVLADPSLVGLLVPRRPVLEHHQFVLSELGFPRFLASSLLIVGSTVFAGLVVNGAAGYALSRLRWRGRRVLLGLVALLLVVPYEAVAVPLFFQVASVGWLDDYGVQILPFVANPFTIYLFVTYFEALPRELEEAARLDGAGPLRTFISVILPQSRPAFAAAAILTFLLQWGVFLWPLMVTNGPEHQPLPVAFGYLSAQKPVRWGAIMAFGTLMVLPVLIVFLAFQRWFVAGISRTGLRFHA